jgi:hypothetical protein
VEDAFRPLLLGLTGGVRSGTTWALPGTNWARHTGQWRFVAVARGYSKPLLAIGVSTRILRTPNGIYLHEIVNGSVAT